MSNFYFRYSALKKYDIEYFCVDGVFMSSVGLKG